MRNPFQHYRSRTQRALALMAEVHLNNSTPTSEPAEPAVMPLAQHELLAQMEALRNQRDTRLPYDPIGPTSPYNMQFTPRYREQ